MVALNTSNENGGYYFIFLKTGRKIHRFIWTKFSITEKVITMVKELGKKNKKVLMKNCRFLNGCQGKS